jgi:hypothetical protein
VPQGEGRLSDPVNAGWLLEQVLAVDPAVARLRLGAVRFVERLFPDQGPEGVAHVMRAARGFLEVPSLMLVLERMGITDPQVLATAAARARDLSEGAGNAERLLRLAQFQAALALLDRASRARAMAPERVRAATGRLLALEPAAQGYGPALAQWILDDLLGLARAGDDQPTDADARMIQVLAGPAGDATAGPLVWEGLPYMVDRSVPERRRLERLLRVQQAPPLAAVLAFAREAARLLDAADPSSREDLRRAALGAADAVGAIRQPLFSRRARPVSLRSLVEPLIAGPAAPGAVLSDEAQGALLALVNGALAESLLTMLYATHLGDPDGPIGLIPEMARYHAFDVGATGDSTGVDDAWQLPVELRSSGGGWRVAGSLLVLEHALAGLVLRVPQNGEMPEPSRLSEAGQHVVALSVALLDATALRDGTRATIVDRLARGRQRLARWCQRADEAVVSASEWRVATARWACDHEPEAVEGFWSDTDAFWAAGPLEETGDLDPWGGIDLPLEGPLSSRWPADRPLDDLEGRPATGRIAERFVELTLRIASMTAARGLPAAIVPAVLERAAFDMLHAAPLVQPDDWYRLSRYVATLRDDQVEDYIAALAAEGPLVPAASGEGR